MKSTVLNRMPRTSPSCEQSKAFVQDGSLSAAFMLSACRVSLYCSTKLLRGAFASKGTTDGISSTVLPCATGGGVGYWIDKGMGDGIVKLVKVLAC